MGAIPFTAVAVSALLVELRVGHVGDLCDQRQVVATEGVGRFPLLAVLVQALEGHAVADADLGVVRPNSTLDDLEGTEFAAPGLADTGGIECASSQRRSTPAEDPFNLNPDLLYPIIDAMTVKRTRRFVKRHYSDDLIELPDGRVEPIRFPRPIASSINYDLEEVLPGFLAKLEDALMPPTGSPQLRFARYKPENYPAGQPPLGGDPAIVGLLRSGLLKRFESSVHAFAQTVAKMVEEHDFFLQGLDRGVVIQKELLHELSAADEDDAFDELLAASPHTERAEAYNVEALRSDVHGHAPNEAIIGFILRHTHSPATRGRLPLAAKEGAGGDIVFRWAIGATSRRIRDESSALALKRMVVYSTYTRRFGVGPHGGQRHTQPVAPFVVALCSAPPWRACHVWPHKRTATALQRTPPGFRPLSNQSTLPDSPV